MADGDLPRIAADQVPCRGGKRGEHHQRANALDELVLDQQGPDEQRGQRCHAQHPTAGGVRRRGNRRRAHALPSRPCGRNHSTARKRMKTTTSLKAGPIQKELSDSMTPMASPATSAPGTLPKPPRQTTTKAISASDSPTIGEM